MNVADSVMYLVVTDLDPQGMDTFFCGYLWGNHPSRVS